MPIKALSGIGNIISEEDKRWVAVAKDQEERIVELERVVGEQDDKLKDARENLKKWGEERQKIARAIQDIQKTIGMYGQVAVQGTQGYASPVQNWGTGSVPLPVFSSNSHSGGTAINGDFL